MDSQRLLGYGRATWAWWLEGILHLLPPALRTRWFPTPEILEVRWDGVAMAWVHRSSAGEVLATQHTPLTAVAGSELSTWLTSQVPISATVILFVPQIRVLSRTLQLPLAVEPDLRSMLELDLDRLTPFTPDAVYLDANVCSRNTETQTLTCRFAVIKRMDVDSILQTLRQLGRPAHAVRIDPGFEVMLDLLPPALRPRGDVQARQRTVFAYSVALALLITALFAPLPHQDALLSDWQRQVAAQKEAASAAQALLVQRTALAERTRFVAARRSELRPMVEALTELTLRLPDNAWVNRLMTQGDDIQIYGEAESATGLVPLLESSDLFQQVDFRSPTTRNEATGKDRFHLGLHLTPLVTKP